MPFLQNFTHGTIVLSDGTGTALTHTMDMDNGDLAFTGHVPGGREMADYERKGAHVSSAFTTRKYPQITLTAQVADFKDTGSGTISDFIFAISGTPYANRISTLDPSGATSGKVPFGCTIQFTAEGTNFGASADRTFTAAKCRIDSFDFSEGDPSTLSLSFTVLGAITGDLATTIATS